MSDLRVGIDAVRRNPATSGDIRARLEAAVAEFGSVSGATVAQEQLRDRLDERVPYAALALDSTRLRGPESNAGQPESEA